MSLDRMVGTTCVAPFPIYADLTETFTAPHATGAPQRHATVAHALGICAGYAYADIETVATMMARLGIERPACVRITQIVDAMFIFSTAYLVQSRCGRVLILCYRGTEPGTLGNWLGDADVGLDSSTLAFASGTEKVRVHAGFHRNLRATWLPVLGELAAAVDGRSLLDHDARVQHPLEALFVTGHSLGGAMAVLFALSLCNTESQRAIAERLRAVYTFGQPMVLAGQLPRAIDSLEPKLFRHVLPEDPVPALPPEPWGPFVHFGQEYHFVQGDWQRAQSPVGQLPSVREVLRSGLAFFANARRHGSFQYNFAKHPPHHYIAALRPHGRVSEFGD
ncbi:MAG: lipase family protein [Xanthobacteraceae bacterium]